MKTIPLTQLLQVSRYSVALVLFLISACSSTTGNYHSDSFATGPRSHYSAPAPGDDVIGRNDVAHVSGGENISDVSKQFDVGATEIQEANPSLTEYQISYSKNIILPRKYILPPTQYRKGIVINIAELRLYYFDQGGGVMTFPVALGRDGWRTPMGKTSVIRKESQPTWNVPESVREYMFEEHGKELPNSVPPGPENPLGHYAIYLGLEGYLIHGTNNPESIGRLVSSGCIRMYNRDVEQLFEQVHKGTPVNIVYFPNKVGWQGDGLYLEAHTPVHGDNEVYASNEIPVMQLIASETRYKPARIDWRRVNEVLSQHNGVPTLIGVKQM